MPRTTGATINTRIKLGADPEFVWFEGSNFVDASRVTQGARSSAQLGTDGCYNTGELRPGPGHPMHVWHEINRLLKQAAEYPYDMYAGSGKHVPTGGHIHFSGINHTPELLSKLDKFIAIPLNEVSDRSARRSYGALSEVRTQPHGWEYRSPCSWIVHPVIAKGVLRVAWVLALAAEMGRLTEINEVEDIINFASNCDHPHATRCHVKDFYKMLKRMKRANIKMEQVEVFQAWKKKARRDSTSNETVRTIPQVVFSTDDFNMGSVRREFDLIVRTENVVRSTTSVYNVYGASIARTEDRVVFTPPGYTNPTMAMVPGVRYEEWTNSYFGLSYSLREEPVVAARALYNVLKTLETVVNTTGNAAILNVIEGRRTSCAA